MKFILSNNKQKASKCSRKIYVAIPVFNSNINRYLICANNLWNAKKYVNKNFHVTECDQHALCKFDDEILLAEFLAKNLLTNGVFAKLERASNCFSWVRSQERKHILEKAREQ